MSDLYNQLFSPLGKEWCAYFLYLMYFSFAALVLTILASVFDMLQKNEKLPISFNETYATTLSTFLVLKSLKNEGKSYRI